MKVSSKMKFFVNFKSIRESVITLIVFVEKCIRLSTKCRINFDFAFIIKIFVSVSLLQNGKIDFDRLGINVNFNCAVTSERYY